MLPSMTKQDKGSLEGHVEQIDSLALRNMWNVYVQVHDGCNTSSLHYSCCSSVFALFAPDSAPPSASSAERLTAVPAGISSADVLCLLARFSSRCLFFAATNARNASCPTAP